MARLGDFLDKQGHFLLENDMPALIYIAALAVIPFTAWLSAAAIGLITLRKGLSEGFKGFIVAFGSLFILSLMTRSLTSALITALIAFLPCYLTAAVLHSSASWKVAGGVLVLQVLVAVALIHWLAPEFIMNQYQYIQAIIKGFEKQNSNSFLLSDQSKLHQTVLANYLLGVQLTSLAFSALVSLLLARYVQSRLFYPGGFRQEMLGFRASSLGVILLAIAALGAYQHYSLAISCLPILVAYYVLAGLSLIFSIVAKDKGFGNLILIIIPLILLPFVVIPIYAILGALDSLFNFRSYLSAKTDKKVNKG